uniref:P-type ATPase A domain-containing protein n=1 Tax=Pavo cristatus TaxID=9049 RepID=A0A8C9ESW6_PAVCR
MICSPLFPHPISCYALCPSSDKCYVCICFKELESRYLVPGDVFLLDGKKLSLPCDAVLIDGSCIVNEGMLTGESIPVMKTLLPLTESPEPWKTHSMEDYRRHVLFCGTEVIQAKSSGRGPARAVVLQTGTSIPKLPVADVVAMALLLLTAAVPPAIPAALTTGTVYAQRRLKKKKIFCITPQRINICGQINLVCFDKVRHFLGQ